MSLSPSTSDNHSREEGTHPLSPALVMWKAFLTVFVIAPWAMISLCGLFFNTLFGMAWLPPGARYIGAVAALVVPVIPMWCVYSVAACVWKQSVGKAPLLGTLAGWLLLSWVSISSLEKIPGYLQVMESSTDSTAKLKVFIGLSVWIGGWLLCSCIIVRRFVHKF